MDTTAIVIGCIIGAGIFRVATPLAAAVPAPGIILVLWVLGGVVSLCGALTYAALATAYPQAGGDYIFISRAYGPVAGFLFGWTKVFIERTGTIAVLAYVCAEFLGSVVPYGTGGVKVVAIAAIGLLTAANTAGVRYGTRVQNMATAVKLLAMAVVIVCGGVGTWAAGGPVPQPWWPAVWDPGWVSAAGVAFVFVLWTYGGWTEAAYVAEEVRNPERTVPRAIVGGTLVVTAIYLAVNAVYFAGLPVEAMGRDPLVPATLLERILGPWGRTLVVGMVVCSTFGTLNGMILTGGRLLFAMGRDHALITPLGRLHPRRGTPARALLVNAVVASLLVLTKTLDQIITYSTVVISAFFAMVGWSVFILKRREVPMAHVGFWWGYPVTPVVFSATLVAFIANACIRAPAEVLFGLVLLLLGLPLYGWSQRVGAGGPVGQGAGDGGQTAAG